MIESFLFGVGGKLISNLINSYLANSSEEKRNSIHSHKSAEWVRAQLELQREISKDWWAKFCRFIIYVLITCTFSFITVYAMIHPEQTDVLIDVKGGFLSNLFRQPVKTVQQVHSTGLVFQSCLEVMFAVLGAFVTPSQK